MSEKQIEKLKGLCYRMLKEGDLMDSLINGLKKDENDNSMQERWWSVSDEAYKFLREMAKESVVIS